MGALTRDPELKYLPNGNPVCEFGLAMNESWRDKDGNKHESVTFVDCVMFGKRGEAIAGYTKKGQPLYVEGRLKLETWEKDGQKRSKMRVLAEAFEFLSSGKRDGAPTGNTSAPPSDDDALAPDDSDSIPF